MNKNEFPLFRVIASRGSDTFGMKLAAKNMRHAIHRARRMLEGSGYSVYPYKA